MNRRTLISALASLPLVGGMVSGATAIEPSADHATDGTMTLINARDELKPGLWAYNRDYNPEIEFDIIVMSHCLVVDAYRRENNARLGFAITTTSIKDNAHKAMMAPSCDALVRAVRQALRTDFESGGRYS